MARTAKMVGIFLIASGLALAISFTVVAVRQEEYRKAVLLVERNPGNVMYEGQYHIAALWRAILAGVAVCGLLIVLNGTTFLLLGTVASRQERTTRS